MRFIFKDTLDDVKYDNIHSVGHSADAMVAFDMSDDPLGDGVDSPHITLIYLGKVVDVIDKFDVLNTQLYAFSQDHAPINGLFSGFAVFPASVENDNKAPIVRLLDSPDLPAFRYVLLHELAVAILSILNQDHGYTAHMTVDYTTDPKVVIPVHNGIDYVKTFDAITLYMGDVKYNYPLMGHIIEKQLPIDSKSANNLLQIRLGIFDNDIDALAEQLFTGSITIGQWTEDMKQLIRGIHTGSAVIGKLGWDNMTPSDWGRVGAEVKKQYRFLQGFAEDIIANKDTMTLQAIEARAHMYGQAGIHTAALMQAGNLAGGTRRNPTGYDSLPWLPGDGSTRCLTSCRCHWIIEVIGGYGDLQQIQATWVVDPLAESCPDCIDRDNYTIVLNVPSDWEIPSVVGVE
jgi:2'-5' RNA ligase